MLYPVLALSLLAAQTSPPNGVSAPSSQVQAQSGGAIASELAEKLIGARRVFVESFGEGPINETLRAMIIDSVRTSGRFIVTENREKADLVMAGSAFEKTTQETHALGSATAVAGAAGGSSASVNGTPQHVTGSSHGGFRAAAAAIDDAQLSTEAVHDARAAVRLISRDGDVVWSTTQESRGAKYKSATSDVADKVVKQLMRDLNRLKSR